MQNVDAKPTSAAAEIQANKVLTGTVKKIDRQARFFNIYDKVSIEGTLAALRQVIPA